MRCGLRFAAATLLPAGALIFSPCSAAHAQAFAETANGFGAGFGFGLLVCIILALLITLSHL